MLYTIDTRVFNSVRDIPIEVTGVDSSDFRFPFCRKTSLLGEAYYCRAPHERSIRKNYVGAPLLSCSTRQKLALRKPVRVARYTANNDEKNTDGIPTILLCSLSVEEQIVVQML